MAIWLILNIYVMSKSLQRKMLDIVFLWVWTMQSEWIDMFTWSDVGFISFFKYKLLGRVVVTVKAFS